VPPSATDAAPVAVDCAVAASAWHSAPADDIPRLRADAAAAFDTLSAGVLKQADEQSLVALLAVRAALDGAGRRPADCEHWGLVAAPRMPGRRRIAESLAKYREQGAWSVSPHVIPHCSLHSLPGLLSQALNQHGPNIGAGGMIGGEAEALWGALALLAGERLPGVWLILTGWDRESLSTGGVSCQAVVLGLLPAAQAPALPRVRFVPGVRQRGAPAFTLEAVGDAVRRRRDVTWAAGTGACTLAHAARGLEAAA
jgi:hypothetical protein